MAIFPADDLAYSAATRARLRPLLGWRHDFVELVKRSESEAGRSQRRDVWGRTRFVGEGMFDLREADAAYIMWFWQSQRLNAFDFFNFAKTYQLDVLGTGNGVTTVFELPAKEVVQSSIIVYVNNVVTNNFTFSVGTGTAGRDRIVLNTPAPNGQKVTSSYTGRHYYLCEFPQPPTFVSHRYSSVQIGMMFREVF